MAISEIEPHSVVRRILLAVCKMRERAAHPEMQCQPTGWSEIDQEMLAVTLRERVPEPNEAGEGSSGTRRLVRCTGR